jgi:hypothetical protein
MIQAEAMTVIQCSLEEAFHYVATGFFDHYPKWEPAVLELEKTSSDPIGLGTTGRQILNFGRPEESAFQISEFEPNRKFSVTSAGKPYFKNQYTFELLDHNTKLTYSFEFRIDGFGKLIEPLIAGSAKKGTQTVVDNLKKLLEGNI